MMIVDPTRFPQPLIELHVEHHATGRREIARVLALHPRIDDLLHLFLEHPLRLSRDVLGAISLYEIANRNRLVEVILDRSVLIPVSHSTKVVVLLYCTVLELRMKLVEHALAFRVIA